MGVGESKWVWVGCGCERVVVFKVGRRWRVGNCQHLKSRNLYSVTELLY